MGNRTIIRQNFDAVEIKPRAVPDFDGIRAIDIENNGTTIQLSDKTLGELFTSKVPDHTDLQWITEKNRIVAILTAQGMSKQEIEHELDINKPLGREQRKIKSTSNFITRRWDI